MMMMMMGCGGGVGGGHDDVLFKSTSISLGIYSTFVMS